MPRLELICPSYFSVDANTSFIWTCKLHAAASWRLLMCPSWMVRQPEANSHLSVHCLKKMRLDALPSWLPVSFYLGTILMWMYFHSYASSKCLSEHPKRLVQFLSFKDKDYNRKYFWCASSMTGNAKKTNAKEMICQTDFSCSQLSLYPPRIFEQD